MSLFLRGLRLFLKLRLRTVLKLSRHPQDKSISWRREKQLEEFFFESFSISERKKKFFCVFAKEEDNEFCNERINFNVETGEEN